MIEQEYRVRMVLDNLPVTMFDLQNDVGDACAVWRGRAPATCCTRVRRPHAAARLQPTLRPPASCVHALPPQNEFVRPGFELGYEDGNKFYIHNHLRFNILVRASGWGRR